MRHFRIDTLVMCPKVSLSDVFAHHILDISDSLGQCREMDISGALIINVLRVGTGWHD